MKRNIKLVAVDGLRAHPLNKELYGPPTANSAYADIKLLMKRNGFDLLRHLLLATADGRVIHGVTRLAVAKSISLTEVPCELLPEGGF